MKLRIQHKCSLWTSSCPQDRGWPRPNPNPCKPSTSNVYIPRLSIRSFLVHEKFEGAEHELHGEPLRSQYHLIPSTGDQLGQGVSCNVAFLVFLVLIASPVPIACHGAALSCRWSGHPPRLAHTLFQLSKIRPRHTPTRTGFYALRVYRRSGRNRSRCFPLPAKCVAISGDVGEAFLYCFRHDPTRRPA